MLHTLQRTLKIFHSTAELEYLSTRNHSFRRNGLGAMGIGGLFIGFIGGVSFTSILFFGFYLFYPQSNSPISNKHLLIILFLWMIYSLFLCIFHTLEFFLTALKQPNNLSYDSFLINHSQAYTLAILSCIIEYTIESLLFSFKSSFSTMRIIGLFLMIFGQIIRSCAMYTCGEHFAHQIMMEKTKGHQLVTSGIYAYLRHPSYFGWFYWCIGTQLFLANPICTLLYTYASWSFFSERIPHEEELLVDFYQQEYVSYCKRTVIGIPFISSSVGKNSSD